MHFIRRFRIPAIFCALAVLICELIAHPYTTMGVCDDGPYILVTQKLATTGHIVYNGWSAAMLVWQLYLGAALIKLFGFSFTTVRMSTLLVAMALAFFLQRIMVRSAITERNATIGTLALVLSPLYLLLSATFMSDVHGLFAIVLCLYGCLRALQAASPRATIAWLCFAVATNAICGTSRQLAWLGILVMVPSTLWLLRAQRRILLAGAAATAAGVLFILGCMLWLKHQPYTTPETFQVSNIPVAYLVKQFLYFFLDIPFLLLPIVVLFLPEIRKSCPRVIAIFCALFLGYFFLATYPSHLRGGFSSLLEPTLGDWVNVYGGYEDLANGTAPIFLHTWVRLLLTFVVFCSLFCLVSSLIRSGGMPPAKNSSSGISWKELGVLLAPFTIAYTLLLMYRAVTIANAGTPVILDRYSLGLLVVALVLLVRYYQERIQLQLPLAGVLLVGMTAMYGVVVTHNMFAFYRAREAIAAELRAASIPDTSVDNGWEYNINVELHQAGYINNPGIVLPVHAYIPTPPPPAGICKLFWYNYTPHIHPLYGISSDPNACYGPAPFAPVPFSHWLTSTPGTLYVVRYTPDSKP
jgi:hypothetical protein